PAASPPPVSSSTPPASSPAPVPEVEVFAVDEVDVSTGPAGPVAEEVVMVAVPCAPPSAGAATGSAPATIDALLHETRRFAPSSVFAAQANINDPTVYESAAADPEGFWAEASQRLDWFTPWERVLEWNPPSAKWFVGGQLNASYNCVDRHALGGRADKRAIV